MGAATTLVTGGSVYDRTKSKLQEALSAWLASNPSLELLTGTAVEVDDHNAPTPDISLVLHENGGHRTTGLLQGAPELAVEIVSTELATQLNVKIEFYLAHGSKSVWVVYPELRVIRVFDAAGGSVRFRENQTLQDPALPGFSAPVSSIFEGI